MSKPLALVLFAAACTTTNNDRRYLPGSTDNGDQLEAGTQVVASNGLSDVLALLPPPDDVTLGDGFLDPLTSSFIPANGGGSAQPLVSVELPAAIGGAPIRVFVGRRIALTGNLVTPFFVDGGQAIAFAATDELDVAGTLESVTGSVDIAGCTGGDSTSTAAGGGGGGFATSGGAGGAVSFHGTVTSPAAPGGTADPDATLVPLRGGCPGGRPGGLGLGGIPGGAIQLFSQQRIDIAGAVVADALSAEIGEGGGGGGGILIEAPVVAFGDGAVLSARGGGGASGDTADASNGNFGSSLSGATCASALCGSGGDGAVGATANGLPGASTDGSGTLAHPVIAPSGGGGGGIGTVRINTLDGTTLGSAAIVSAAMTIGTLTAR
jgi:hypothetical protein